MTRRPPRPGPSLRRDDREAYRAPAAAERTLPKDRILMAADFPDGVDASQRLVWFAAAVLCDYATGMLDVSLSTICRLTGQHRHTAAKQIEHLVEHGLLRRVPEIDRRTGMELPRGRTGRPDRYRLLAPGDLPSRVSNFSTPGVENHDTQGVEDRDTSGVEERDTGVSKGCREGVEGVSNPSTHSVDLKLSRSKSPPPSPPARSAPPRAVDRPSARCAPPMAPRADGLAEAPPMRERIPIAEALEQRARSDAERREAQRRAAAARAAEVAVEAEAKQRERRIDTMTMRLHRVAETVRLPIVVSTWIAELLVAGDLDAAEAQLDRVERGESVAPPADFVRRDEEERQRRREQLARMQQTAGAATRADA